MNKKIFFASLLAFIALFIPVSLFSNSSMELHTGNGVINPASFNSSFYDGYTVAASPSLPLTGAPVNYTNRLYDATLYFKGFVNDRFDVKLAFSYLHANFETKLTPSPSLSVTSKLTVPYLYAGIGADFYHEISPRFSMFAGADAGINYQIGMFSSVEPVSGAELTSDGFYAGDGIGYAVNTKAGFEWLMTDSFGFTAYGGYRKGEIKVKFPGKIPLQEPLFPNTIADISGPIYGAGIVLYDAGGSVKDTQTEPSKDKKPVTRLRQFTGDKKSELQKFTELKSGVNYFLPVYDTRLKLFSATSSVKPQEKPRRTAFIFNPSNEADSAKFINDRANEKHFSAATGQSETASLVNQSVVQQTRVQKPVLSAAAKMMKASVYTAASFGSLINIKEDSKRWFSFELDNAPGAVEVVWQVSSAQFTGARDNWKNPPALIKSGKIPASAKEFQVDFGDTASRKMQVISQYKPMEKNRKSLYVRAVPVDGLGNPVGDPGQGTAVILGEEKFNIASLTPAYEIWSALDLTGTYSGEFQDKPKHRDEVNVNPRDSDAKKLFVINGYKGKKGKLLIQVSDKPFSEADNAAGSTLYEKYFDLPVDKNDLPSYFPLLSYPVAVIIPFAEFGKKVSDLKENDYIKYYVRGIIQKAGPAQGIYAAELTDTAVVNYGFGSTFKWVGPPAPTYKKLNRSLPRISMKSYTPAQWQARDCFSHYYVYRAPKANEITCRWLNLQTNEVLRPYIFPDDKAYYAKQGINNADQYEKIVIPRVLKEGTLIYFPEPKEEDKPWYEELYEGVVQFFEDLAMIASTIVNQVSASYNNLKAGLIQFVANLCPIDSLKGAFKMALEGLVNYGMVCVGVPPTLPNFDELTSMSLDYLAETALSEAGIPPNELTKELTDKVAGEIKEQVKSAAAVGVPNPVKAAFLKLDPAYIYRPAYVDVEFRNDTDYYSVPGTFDINVTFEFDYWTMTSSNYNPAGGITFSYPNPYAAGSSAAIYTSMQYQKHFLYGLNGDTLNYSQGDTAVYDVFKPATANTVPVLRPHETVTARIYLDPMEGGLGRYPQGDAVTRDDFEVMYFGNGNKKFTNFYMTGDFPKPAEFQASQGVYNFEQNVEYIYQNYGSTSQELKQKPVSDGW